MTETTDQATEQPTDESTDETTQQQGPGRRILAGFFWLLAVLALLVGSVTLWAHQTLLTSDGWTTVVSGVASDEEVIESASARIVDRLAESLNVQETLTDILPGEMDSVAGAITLVVQDKVAEGVANVAGSEGFQDAFVNVNRAAHDAAMKVIRGGDSEALTSEEGAITLNVFPLVEGALVALQDAGLIDESREIPSLSEYEPPAETVARLETLLGRDIPDDIGTITLIESDKLARVQTAVRAFDVITIVLLLLALVCVALALWLSARRVRMVVWLAVGAVGALLLGRGFTRLVLEDVTGALRDGDGSVAVRAVIETAVDSLMWFTFALIVVALIVVGLAMWAERRSEPGEGLTESTEDLDLSDWLRSRSRAIGAIGIGIIAFVVLWNVGGPDITLLAAAMVGIVLVGVGVLASRDEGTDEAATSEIESG